MFNLINVIDFCELKVNFKTGKRRGKKKQNKNILSQFKNEWIFMENLVNCLAVIVFDPVDTWTPIFGHSFANSVMAEMEIYILKQNTHTTTNRVVFFFFLSARNSARV